MAEEPASDRPSERETGHLWYRGYEWWGDRRGFPWLGLLLVALGAGLVVGQADVGVRAVHALALFAGLVFWAAFAFGWAGWSGLFAAILSGWGLARVLEDLGYIAGSGWTALLVGAAFLAVYLVGLSRQAGRHGWALWIGVALVVLGAAQIALREIPGMPPLDAYVVPVILIIVGAWLVFRAVRTRPE